MTIAADRFTRCPKAVPLRESTAAFISAWVSRCGVPDHITSDRGVQFVSALWQQLTDTCGASLRPTTAYHPQANSLVECLHQQLKSTLRAHLASGNWVAQLPWVLLGLQTQWREDLRSSTAELVYGEPLVVPGFIVHRADFNQHQIRDKLRTDVQRLLPTPTSLHGNHVIHVPSTLQSTDYVFVRHNAAHGPLQPPYKGPFLVIAKGDKSFLLDYGNRAERVSIDRLKPAFVDTSRDSRTVAPKRGRPAQRRLERSCGGSTT